MPKTTKTGKPKQDELPSTLQRSAKKAQRTFAKAHDSAADQYGDARSGPTRSRGPRSSTAYEKVGDHWEKKDDEGAQRQAGRAGARQHGRRPRAASTPTRPRTTCSRSPSGSTSPAARR